MAVPTKVNLYYGDGDNLCVISQIYHCHHSVPWDELAAIMACMSNSYQFYIPRRTLCSNAAFHPQWRRFGLSRKSLCSSAMRAL